jgi:hypothetical protein
VNADRNLERKSAYWTACEECGAWVSSEMIGTDGAGETDEGGFCCTSCQFGADDD